MKVIVTQKHIDEGEVGDPCLCPVALALLDMGYKQVNVEPRQINILTDAKNSVWEQYATPKAVEIFIEDFDYYGDVAPFEFELASA